MAYDAHITRSPDWASPETRISRPQWSELLEARPELAGWLRYNGGVITAKRPSRAQLADMIEIAQGLGAFVQGDDGEVYADVDAAATILRPGIWERLRLLLARCSRRRRARAQPPPFSKGARVRSPTRGSGTVVAVDPGANHGLGRLTVRFDDGGKVTHACVAHGLESVAEDDRRREP